MAHKKAGGSTQNVRTANPKYLGVKKFGGEVVTTGNVIIRQKGSKYKAGANAYMGKDFTIHAAVDGVVEFGQIRTERFDGRHYRRTVVNVKANEAA